jgi:hypothetical protein
LPGARRYIDDPAVAARDHVRHEDAAHVDRAEPIGDRVMCGFDARHIGHVHPCRHHLCV